MLLAFPWWIRRGAVAVISVALVALALSGAAHSAQGDYTRAKSPADTSVMIKAFAPSIVVDTAAGDDKGDAAAQANDKKHEVRVRIDDDDDFDRFSTEVKRSPWIIGLIFLVVGSIFLTPVILLIGIIWYKLRKARLQHEAMLALVEKGVVPPAQAADAIAAGASLATAAPQIYQQAVAARKRIVWSDLRKGVILSMVGLGFLFYAVTGSGEPSWVGLILLFVGVGYIVLWWLEGRHLERTSGTRAGNGTGSSGG
jgi:hypothetical protein